MMRQLKPYSKFFKALAQYIETRFGSVEIDAFLSIRSTAEDFALKYWYLNKDVFDEHDYLEFSNDERALIAKLLADKFCFYLKASDEHAYDIHARLAFNVSFDFVSYDDFKNYVKNNHGE